MNMPYINLLALTIQLGAPYRQCRVTTMTIKDNDVMAQLHVLSWPLGKISQKQECCSKMYNKTTITQLGICSETVKS